MPPAPAPAHCFAHAKSSLLAVSLPPSCTPRVTQPAEVLLVLSLATVETLQCDPSLGQSLPPPHQPEPDGRLAGESPPREEAFRRSLQHPLCSFLIDFGRNCNPLSLAYRTLCLRLLLQPWISPAWCPRRPLLICHSTYKTRG